jgi:hypothetical protein
MYGFYVRPNIENGSVSFPPSIQSINLYKNGREVTSPKEKVIRLGWPRELGTAEQKALPSEDIKLIKQHFPKEASANLERILYALYFLPKEHELHQQVKALLEKSFGEPINDLADLPKLISLHPEVFQDNRSVEKLLLLCNHLDFSNPGLLKEILEFFKYTSLVTRIDQSFPGFTETGDLDPGSSFFSSGRSKKVKGLTLISDQQGIDIANSGLRDRNDTLELMPARLNTTGEETVQTNKEGSKEQGKTKSLSKSTGTKANQVQVFSTGKIYNNFVNELEKLLDGDVDFVNLNSKNNQELHQLLDTLISLHSGKAEDSKARPDLLLAKALLTIGESGNNPERKVALLLLKIKNIIPKPNAKDNTPQQAYLYARLILDSLKVDVDPI